MLVSTVDTKPGKLPGVGVGVPFHFIKIALLAFTGLLYMKVWPWHKIVRACSQRSESCSKNRFGSRFASWLGSWFELRAFTSIATAVPITNRACEMILCSYCADWPFDPCMASARISKMHTQESYVPRELCVHKSSEWCSLCGSWSKTPVFCVSKAWFERALRSQRVKSGFQIRKGQNHDPKRLSEHDLILCEQALNLILMSSNIVGMFSSPLLSWYLFVTPLLNLVIARDAAAGYSQDSFLISDFHLEANYSQLQETIHWMWPWYD